MELKQKLYMALWKAMGPLLRYFNIVLEHLWTAPPELPADLL